MRDVTAFVAEVLRIHARYNTEVIEGLDVCPYARPARNAGSSLRRVSLSTAISPALDEIEGELGPQTHVEVAQIIFPLVRGSAQDLLLAASKHAEDRSTRAKGRPIFVHAAFHPDLTYGVDTPSRLVPFFRRSPDPMIQLVRLEVLDDIHRSKPRGSQFFSGSADDLARLLAEPRVESVTDRITRENHERATAGQLERIAGIYDDIARDRARAYAPFLDESD